MKMPTGAADPAAQHVSGASLDARLLRRLLGMVGGPPIEFLLQWSGERVSLDQVRPQHTVRIANRRTLLKLVLDPQMGFGDAYACGDVEVVGDLLSFLHTMYRTGDHLDPCRRCRRASPRDSGTPPQHAGRVARNIHNHYDLGNEFYSLWLGSTMAYTCAYYTAPGHAWTGPRSRRWTTSAASCGLKPGDSVVEAGCGWGSLALHMASRYGARVRAFNISREQVGYARRRARELKLDGQVEFVEDDYRNLSGRYDAFVSVGMLEHVGPDNYGLLGRLARRSLTSTGRGLIHSIGRNHPEPLHPWIERRIFPGAYAPSLGEMMRIFEAGGLSVLDVENLRLHYALTLRGWLALFEGALERVRALFRDETFVRMWRLYLAGSIAAFETGTLQLFQVLFTAADNNAIPMTRDYLYRA